MGSTQGARAPCRASMSANSSAISRAVDAISPNSVRLYCTTALAAQRVYSSGRRGEQAGAHPTQLVCEPGAAQGRVARRERGQDAAVPGQKPRCPSATGAGATRGHAWGQGEWWTDADASSRAGRGGAPAPGEEPTHSRLNPRGAGGAERAGAVLHAAALVLAGAAERAALALREALKRSQALAVENVAAAQQHLRARARWPGRAM